MSPQGRLTTPEAAELAGLKPSTLRGYRASGPAYTKVDGRVTYSVSDIVEWQARRGTSYEGGTTTEPELPWEEMAALSDQLAVLLGRRFQ